jgi:hypothetical protein
VCVRSVSHTVGAMVSERQLKCLWTRVKPPTSSPRQLFPTQILFLTTRGRMIPLHTQVEKRNGTDPFLQDLAGPGDHNRGGSSIPIKSQESQTPSQEGPH